MSDIASYELPVSELQIARDRVLEAVEDFAEAFRTNCHAWEAALALIAYHDRLQAIIYGIPLNSNGRQHNSQASN